MNQVIGELNRLILQASKTLNQPISKYSSVEQWKQQMFDLVDKIAPLKISQAATQTEQTQSLDPTDWNQARQLAHQLLDQSFDEVQFRRSNPVWRQIPDEVRSTIQQEPCPYKEQTLENVFEDVSNYIVPYTRGNTHPRFWGWVMGEGTVAGILAELVAATLNINAGGCTHSAALVERTVIRWIREIFGFPDIEHGGIVVNGTSSATVLCLATARQHLLSDVRRTGIVSGPKLIVYSSSEVHICLVKALEMLGLGSDSLHAIPVDENFCLDIDKLEQAILDDRANGFTPFCIVGTAGTVNTGAFDDLQQLAQIAQREKLWFHVDGAFGALIILDPARRHLVAGIGNADSLAFDFHKWLHCPYDAGCVLIRDGRHLLSTFSVHQSYLANAERGCAGDKPWFCDLGIDFSRSFRALKVWCTLKQHGFVKLGKKIADNCEQAVYLESLLEKYSDIMRVVRPVTLNIVNFRFESVDLKSRLSDEEIDQLNSDVLADLQESGEAVASSTKFNGRLFIRVCINSHRTIFEDCLIFVESIVAFYRARMNVV